MYAKIFAQIFDSSLAEDYVTRHIFMDLIVLADPEGQLDMTYEAIARRTNVPLEIVQESIHKLCKPDVNSRVKRERGKRLVPLDAERSWGWQIVNYKMYRSLKNQITRREYMRLYMQKRRAEEVARVNTSKTSKQNVSIRSKQKKEAYEEEKVQQTYVEPGKKPPVPTCPITEVLGWWNIVAAKLGLATVRVKGFAESRKKKLRQRWQEWGETDEERIATFETVLKKIGESDFLRGKEKGNWRIDFAFLIENDHNWQKVHRGGFGEGEGKQWTI